MGYFGGAFVFTDEPAWQKLNKFDSSINFCGYKHTERNLWLLDYWVRGKHAYPFIGAYEESVLEALPEDDTAKNFSTIRTALRSHIDDVAYGAAWHKFAVAIAVELQIRTFFFAGDDECYDFACQINADGSTKTIACRFDPFHVKFANNRWAITPRQYADEETDFDDQLLAQLGSIPNTQVNQPVSMDAPEFYENASQEWPDDAGAPDKMLGIGTWDPYLNVERDYAVVWERLKTG